VHETNGVDPSWQILLNEAVPNDWVFGRDLFFTYGPFGFIHARMYHPETWIVLVVVWIGVSIVLADLVLEPVMLETMRFVFWGKLRNPSVIWRV
jgi:hypothetical protein